MEENTQKKESPYDCKAEMIDDDNFILRCKRKVLETKKEIFN